MIKSDILSVIMNKARGRILRTNSVDYWNSRFGRNWEMQEGRIQTAYFAAAFAVQREEWEPESILDYGCGLGDSLPILRMRFPESRLYYYDFSEIAMKKISQRFSDTGARPLTETTEKVDLVYSSNVIEHVESAKDFCETLANHAKNHIIIQAPYRETHADGSHLSQERPIDEHVRTVDETLLDSIAHIAKWRIKISSVPFAWRKGPQIFLIGDLR